MRTVLVLGTISRAKRAKKNFHPPFGARNFAIWQKSGGGQFALSSPSKILGGRVPPWSTPMVRMKLAKWDDRGEEMNQEEGDQDVADKVSKKVDSRGEVMRSEKNDW